MNRSNLIKFYIESFLISIVVLILTSCLVLRFTLLNQNYIEDRLDKSNFYTNLVNDLNTSIDEDLMSTGFDITLVNDLYSTDSFKEDIHSILISLYNNLEYNYDSSKFREDLTNNVYNLLKEKKASYNDKEINSFINKIVKDYDNQAGIVKYVSELSKIINILEIASLIIIIVCIIILVVFILRKKRDSLNYLSISLFFTSFLYLFLYFYINIKFDIKNFVFYNNSISYLVRELFTNFLNILLVISIIYIIISIVSLILKKERE